jgi:SAM-dependent MidA family methyltransferase
LETGNTALIQLIRAQIQKHGPVPFAWFMEQALYHPQHGYYSSGRAVIGRKGDYFTNVSVGPLFGQLLAAQFVEIWERLGKIDNFTIVEQGAHDGRFARDVLLAIRVRSPEFFSALRYRIVEPFPVWQDRQSQTLAEFGDRVECCESLDRLEPFVGVHFSNELLDAMPMRLLGPDGGTRAVVSRIFGRRQRAALQEKLVALQGNELVFIEKPSKETERSPAIFTWIDTLSTKLNRGFVIAIDFGFVREDFREVLQARAQHRLLDSPFEQIGDADITAHINWTEIAERAETNGLHIAGFTDQHHFFTGIISAWPNLLSASVSNSTALSSQVHHADEDAKSKRALQTLLHPEMLGRAFQVLTLSKGVDLAEPLAGFTFARDPRAALGI